MAASGLLGAGFLAGCGALLLHRVATETNEEKAIREMTAHLMAVKRAYARTAAFMAQAERRDEQRLADAGVSGGAVNSAQDSEQDHGHSQL